VHLTLAGALVTVVALVHRDHHQLAWLGGLLLAAATWVRPYDVGVQAPEAYTLPTAVALLAVGLHRLHRSPEVDTVAALLPGLGLALAPTLLWALAYPLSPRAAVAGLAALVLVLAGSVLRWTAPVVVGWLAGLALVLRELAPYAAQTPQWVLIGGAGALLIVAGISWETQVRELRRAAGYLERLR
jgi:cell division protein FtsW (lipid II flippase)